MKHFVGIDLHSDNAYVAVIDEAGEIKYQQRFKNDSSMIIGSLKVFQSDIAGVVVESTFNWYWLVDALEAAGFQAYLANPGAMQQYSGLKYADDKTDAAWLANMLRLGILPTGYIYPRKERPLRDMLRKRAELVRHRTSLMIGLKGFVHNWTGENPGRGMIKDAAAGQIEALLEDPLNRESAKKMAEVIGVLNQKIAELEESVKSRVELRKPFDHLQEVWGIGKILASTIMLETGDIRRFPDSGNYTSYCRGVGSTRISNERKKGSGNRRNGNRYLAWAYLEAAQFMRRFYPQARAWYDRKAARKGRVVAIKALSHKIAKACYFILRDGTKFNPSMMFAPKMSR